MIDRSPYYIFPSQNGLYASTLTEFLHQGGRDPVTMRASICDYLTRIRARVDCSDFSAAYLTRVLYLFGDVLPRDFYEEIKTALLDYPYEDCGGHSMCTWTENHRLYLADSEYLLAQAFPEAIFGDGKSSAYHLAHGRDIILKWNEEVAREGFGEWGSNNYYAETLAAISINFHLTKDSMVRESSRRSLDLLLLDITARTSTEGGFLFNPACARAYVDNKASSRQGNYLRRQLGTLGGESYSVFKDKEASFIFMLSAKDEAGRPLYEFPEQVKAFWHRPVKETFLSEGVALGDYRRKGLLQYSEDNVRYAFQCGALSDFRLVSNTARYLRESGMADNGMLKALKPLTKPVFYRTPLLRILKWFVPTVYDAAAHEEGRVYTYATKRYNLSCAFDYRVGKPLFQQNPFALNLSSEISLFATNPYKVPEKHGAPDYWIGGASAPRTVAYQNTLIALFMPKKGKSGRAMTHLFFPTECFDEVDLGALDQGLLFGRTKGVNVMVRTNPGVHFAGEEENAKDLSLRQDGKISENDYRKLYNLMNFAKGLHYYIFRVDDSLSFEDFVTQSRKEIFKRRGKQVHFDTGSHTFDLSFRGGFLLDGALYHPKFIKLSELYTQILCNQEATNE